ncbi:MAG: hypothetical protein IPL40_03125 [Proteobacteria bacterium]|nr:hypothetical protein [Pseudomonadota bacterium]
MLRVALLFGLVLGACAGPRHLNPRTGEAYAAAVQRQARIDSEATTVEATAEDGQAILAGMRSEGGSEGEARQRSGGLQLMPLAR